MSKIMWNATELYNGTVNGPDTTIPNCNIAQTAGCGFGVDNKTDNSLDVFWEDVLRVRLWQIVPPVLLIVGLAGNALVVAVLRVMKFREHVALFFFFVLAFSDSTVLIVGLLRYWLLYTFDVDMRTLSDAGCKVIFFLTYFSMQLSSWTLAAVTVERFVVIRFSLRARSLVTVTRARVSMAVILLLLALVNGYLLFTQHIQDDSCGSFEGDDIYFFDQYIFIWIDMFVLCIIPFSVMLGCNIVILGEVKANVSRHDKLVLRNGHCEGGEEPKRAGSITLMLLAVNLYFLVTTIPISVYFVLDTFLSSALKNDPSVAAKMNLVWTVFYLLQFTSFSLNFYLYMARGRRFRVAFWKLFGKHSESDTLLESRRLTYGDVTQTISVGRIVRGGVPLLRRSTIGNVNSLLPQRVQHNARRSTLTGLKAVEVARR